jgi:formamidopyrimidine-DNA glycosylase
VPELPEVEIARRQLRRWTEGKRIGGIRLLDPAVLRTKLSSRPSDAVGDAVERLATLVDREPGELLRHGKRLALRVGPDALLVHLGMTGLFVRRPAAEDPPSLARLGLELDGEVAWFVDGRRFGCVVLVPAAEVEARLREGQGPDALDEALDGPALKVAVSSRKAVKVALMEQDRLAGLGNIHAAEACFRARISPHRRADTLTGPEWTRLAGAIVVQLRDAITAEDSDDLVYVNLGGPNPFSVYGREGEPCPVCGGAIRSEVAGGRSTFWCPTCQPDAG